MGIPKALGLEDEYAGKIDRCLTDTVIKVGSGFVVGGIFSLALFKRKAWPVTLGTGIGCGISYSNCQAIMRQHYLPDYQKTPSLVKNVEKLQPVNVPILDENSRVQATEPNTEEISDTSNAVYDTPSENTDNDKTPDNSNNENCTKVEEK